MNFQKHNFGYPISYGATCGVSGDIATNVALGGTVISHIAIMRESLKAASVKGKGGRINVAKSQVQLTNSIYSQYGNKILDLLKEQEIHPYREEFTNKSKLIIKDMFVNKVFNRALQDYAKKVKVPFVVGSPLALTPIAVSKTVLIGWTCIGTAMFGVTIIGSLCLFQYVERKRWLKENNKLEVYLSNYLLVIH